MPSHHTNDWNAVSHGMSVIGYLNEFGLACLWDDARLCESSANLEDFAEGWIALAIRRGYWAYFEDAAKARLECLAARKIA